MVLLGLSVSCHSPEELAEAPAQKGGETTANPSAAEEASASGEKPDDRLEPATEPAEPEEKEPPPKNANPEECWARQFQARSEAQRLACMSEALQCLTLGQLAFEVERLIFWQRPGKEEARALLAKHGVGDFDIMGELQMAIRPGTEPPIYIRIGAWVTEPAQFMAAAKSLLRRNAKVEIVRHKQDLEKLEAEFDAKIAGAAAEQEKRLLKSQKTAAIARMKQQSERYEEILATDQGDKRPETPPLSKVTVVDDKATAIVKREEGPNTYLSFRRINDNWVLALGVKEPEVVRPLPEWRTMRRLAQRGEFKDPWTRRGPDGEREFAGGNRGPNDIPPYRTFIYSGDDKSREPLVDSDLQLLASGAKLWRIDLQNAAKLSAEGFRAILLNKELETVNMRELVIPEGTLASLAKLGDLKEVNLHNVVFSDLDLAEFRKAKPNCKVDESYSLRGEFFDHARELRQKKKLPLPDPMQATSPEESGKAISLDPKRPTLFFLSSKVYPFTESLGPFDVVAKDPAARTPAVRELYRFVHEKKVQVLYAWPPRQEQDESRWWAENPWFQAKVDPQVHLIPADGKTEILSGEITPERILDALKKVLK